MMNKVFLIVTVLLGLTVSASALTTLDETHNGKTVAVPGATKSHGVYAPAAQYTPHGLVVTAPPGADVDVDNDGSDISIDITPRDNRGLLGLGVLGL
jgi:hypothetical protein